MHESLTNHEQIGFVCACASRNWPHFGGVGDRNYWRITHESCINRARIIYNHVRITDISRTTTHMSKYGVVFHEHSMHAWRMNHWRSASKHARFANVNGMNVIRALFMCDMKVGRQWTDVDMCGFEPVLAHKHWWLTRVPHIVTHTWRINYACQLINNAHWRTTVVHQNFF